MLPRFPAAFRPPAFASWASFPARGFRPPYGRPTTPPAAAGTRTGFPCSARVRPGWLRVPSLPRGRRCPHGRMISPAAACRIATASPCHPGPRPAPGCISDEASARVHCHSPHTSLPLACDPGRNGILGLFPELRTRPGRTRQRTPERGQARTLPGLRRWHQPASFRRTHSPRATSRRTNILIWASHGKRECCVLSALPRYWGALRANPVIQLDPAAADAVVRQAIPAVARPACASGTRCGGRMLRVPDRQLLPCPRGG
jgi:hypothetical protein